MCGLVGYTGPERPGMLRRVADLIAHRGPDDEGFWSEPAVHLGFRRLAIQDLTPAGHQPMVSADGRFVIVFNGEIYNAPELRRELQAEGVVFRSTGDTEAVLEAFARRGASIFEGLNGIFAMAIWDVAERRLVLARDHFGIKPLYYARLDGRIAFCSELKGLLAFPDVDRSVDVASLEQLLAFMWVPQPRTILRGVHHLPAGHFATFSPDTGAWRVERYWTWPEGAGGGAAAMSLPEAVEGTRTLLDQAVKRQLLSDVPVGAFLSGGLDSSLIVAGMRNATERVAAYTIDFGSAPSHLDAAASDLPYAVRVADHLGVELHRVPVEARALDLERLVWELDEPIADPAALNTRLIAKAAREHGVIVMLSGQGADELFAGYRRHVGVAAQRQWDRLPAAVRGPATRALLKALPAYGEGATGDVARRAVRFLRAAQGSPEHQLVEQFAFSSVADRRALLAPRGRDLAGRDAGETHAALLRRVAGESTLRQALYLDMTTFMPSLNLTYGDRMSMAVGVEMRVPYLDLDLVRWAWRLPDRFKLGRLGRTKVVLKGVAAEVLPADVVRRPKVGFGAPLRAWITGELREVVRDTLSPSRLAARGLVDPGVVARILGENERRERDHYALIWALLSFELWASRVLEAPRLAA